jgi:hypothetical protein
MGLRASNGAAPAAEEEDVGRLFVWKLMLALRVARTGLDWTGLDWTGLDCRQVKE